MLETAFTNLAAAIESDTDIAALLGGAVTVIRGNSLVDMIAPQQLPVAVCEPGDGETGGEPIGVGSQELGPDFLLAFVWHETDVAKAFTQRLRLPELVSALMQRNPTLNIAGAAAWLASWEPDRGANHPRQRWSCTISVVLRVSK